MRLWERSVIMSLLAPAEIAVGIRSEFESGRTRISTLLSSLLLRFDRIPAKE